MAAVLTGNSAALRGYSDASRRLRASFDQPTIVETERRSLVSDPRPRRLRRTSLGPRRMVRAAGVTADGPSAPERASQSRRRVLESG